MEIRKQRYDTCSLSLMQQLVVWLYRSLPCCVKTLVIWSFTLYCVHMFVHMFVLHSDDIPTCVQDLRHMEI